MSNVTPIFSSVPIIEARPRATEEQIAAWNPTQDWLLVRPDDVWAAAGLVAPDTMSYKPITGTLLRNGPDGMNYLPFGEHPDENTIDRLEEVDCRIQWRLNASVEPIEIGGESLLAVRAREVLAVLS